MMKRVAIGLIGPMLDSGKSESRWERWRPTVALCQQDDLLIDRFILLFQKRYSSLTDLLVEDLKRISPETDVVPHEVEFSDPWDFEEVYGALHDFARACPFDPENEEYLVHITTGTHVAQICLFLLTESRYLPAKLIQTIPPSKRSSDISGDYAIIDLDLSRYDRIAMRFQKETEDDLSFLKSGIDTRNPAFNRLIEQVEKVAARSVDPILITGPTGAGKSRLARRIYDLKKSRRQITGAFVEVNCATIRGDGAMSALFGHIKGAFTGAASDRDGLLRAADKGMLFLDEIGELGHDEQAMLLRAIEEKRFLPVGSDRETGSDFQLICGTNRDLQNHVAGGTFREDLLARINLWVFELPGLKDRPEDIEPNLSYELDKFSERSNRRVTFNREAREWFLSFAMSGKAPWNANFRDLNGAVTRMATLASGGRITKTDVDDEIKRLEAKWSCSEKSQSDGLNLIDDILGPGSAARLDRFERVQLADVLTVCKSSSSLSDAGRTLFSVSRENRSTTNDADRLKKYLSKYGISWGMIT
jgi:transcriptional regulatory protein RtcR